MHGNALECKEMLNAIETKWKCNKRQWNAMWSWRLNFVDSSMFVDARSVLVWRLFVLPGPCFFALGAELLEQCLASAKVLEVVPRLLSAGFLLSSSGVLFEPHVALSDILVTCSSLKSFWFHSPYRVRVEHELNASNDARSLRVRNLGVSLTV